MTDERIEQAKRYAESEHAPRLAREFIKELVEEVEHWKRLSNSQEEAMGMMERGAL